MKECVAVRIMSVRMIMRMTACGDQREDKANLR